MIDYQSLRFDYRRHPDQDAATPARHPVVVVGAGPVGLALAIDLAQREVPVVLLDNDCQLSTGSRAICFAKRTLEIFDRLGCGQRMVDTGVSWNIGKVYFGSEQVYRFDLLPEPGPVAGAEPPQGGDGPPRGVAAEGGRGRTSERPAFINLQQYYVEGYLNERVAELPNIEVRWCNKVVGIELGADGAMLTVETPEGHYRLAADWVAACDGSRSPMRQMLGQEATGRVFRDRFLIADIRLDGGDDALPTERRFWFDPPFHPGQSVLMHRQAGGVWRLDFQLGWDADPQAERQSERIAPRVRAVLDSIGQAGQGFRIEWASVYTFACQRMASFRHGRVLFAGDSAHGVSPFGARGANSGVQDADNLAWKLAAVVHREVEGDAAEALIDSYAREREYAADENILHSTRATDFITPKSAVSRVFRDAVLALSREHAFARTLVNSGRLSVPAVLRDSALNTPDADADFGPAMAPGAAAADAPVVDASGQPGWLLRRCTGARFTALVFGDGPAAQSSMQALAQADEPIDIVRVPGGEGGALAAARYGARDGTTYLLRPDQHVCARWRAPSAGAVRAARRRALGEFAVQEVAA